MIKRLYGAYGSNLNIEQMKKRCPTATLIGTAYLEGYELLYKGKENEAYLTIEHKQDSIVPLGIWDVKEDDEKSLDAYEEFPTVYYKKEFDMMIDCVDGSKEKANVFIYIMDESKPFALPSTYYVNTCEIGYEDFKFDKKYLQEARHKTEVRMG